MGQEQTFWVSKFWFTRPQVDSIEMAFFPAGFESNTANNGRVEPIIVQPASDSVLDCLSLLLDTVMVYLITHGLVSISLLQSISTDFILTLAKMGEHFTAGYPDLAWSDGIDFVVNSGVVIWFETGTRFERIAIGLIQGFWNGVKDAWACGSALGNVILGLIDDFNARGTVINSAFVESPVSVLITNSSGQQSGFLNDGSAVNQIPDAAVLTSVDDRKLILYPGRDIQQILLNGSGSGTFTLTLALAGPQGATYNVRYRDVAITDSAVGYIDLSGATYFLNIDDDGNGSIDRVVAPDDVTLVEPLRDYLPVIVKDCGCSH